MIKISEDIMHIVTYDAYKPVHLYHCPRALPPAAPCPRPRRLLPARPVAGRVVPLAGPSFGHAALAPTGPAPRPHPSPGRALHLAAPYPRPRPVDRPPRRRPCSTLSPTPATPTPPDPDAACPYPGARQSNAEGRPAKRRLLLAVPAAPHGGRSSPWRQLPAAVPPGRTLSSSEEVLEEEGSGCRC
ncbi:uncharacterized protein [Miscanthus floridulus]|uniref:uncharacterized protein n=1 Tax=Miscanthus floridulus TaxID=154761 RepID=UPI0034589295